jgi:predicted dehydrogenase
VNTLKWGIASTGEIAKNMAEAFAADGRGAPLAVSSRSADRARQFAGKHGIQRAYPDLEALLADEDIDAVYIAGPHHTHFEYARKALSAGKHVLREKPLTVNAADSLRLAELSGETGRFLMEAMWTRFIPAMRRIMDLIEAGEIGTVKFVSADFCVNPPYVPEGRLFSPSLAGGALLDLGVYPVSLAQWLFRRFASFSGQVRLADTGVDMAASVSLAGTDGQLASLAFGLDGFKPREAHILGTNGEIFIPELFFRPHRFLVRREGVSDEEIELPFEGNGYIHEIRHVEECVAAGLNESPVMPLADTVETLRICDGLRHEWGIVYPFEES